MWINETLTRGQTNACLTYKSEMLTLGEKAKDDQFEIHNFEVFLV